jgi:hypothetical protein
MKTIIARPKLQGITKASESIRITSEVVNSIIVYVQPLPDPGKNSPGTIITFVKFRTVVRDHTDPISQRFAQSLKEWGDMPAGNTAGNEIK